VKRRATSENPCTLYHSCLVSDLSVVSEEAKIKKTEAKKRLFLPTGIFNRLVSSYWYLRVTKTTGWVKEGFALFGTG
jgi:hypothetical protein